MKSINDIDYDADPDLFYMPSIRNLTPHPLTLLWEDGTKEDILVAGPPVRVATINTPAGSVAVAGTKVPLEEVRYGEPTDLPEPMEGVVLVVSQIAAFAVPHRRDLVFLDGFVRDAQGGILGFTKFGRAAL